jgi:hypothetical protein
MNKGLLLALYDRSGLGAYMPVDYKGHELEVEHHMEKFAELIVLECASVAVKFVQDNKYHEDGISEYWLQDGIKEHFGVE